jgi:hypothetical protein
VVIREPLELMHDPYRGARDPHQRVTVKHVLFRGWDLDIEAQQWAVDLWREARYEATERLRAIELLEPLPPKNTPERRARARRIKQIMQTIRSLTDALERIGHFDKYGTWRKW